MNAPLVGAVLGGAGVALGAFGAHGLKRRVSGEQLAVFETGVRYQLVHALALLACGAAPGAAWAFTLGTVVFSGSLYALALGGPRKLGAITPLGGLALIAGWVALAVSLAGA